MKRFAFRSQWGGDALVAARRRGRRRPTEFTDAAVTVPVGWIAFSGDDVVLTSKAKDDKRFLVRPNGFTDIVPIAKKEFGYVASVSGDTAQFTWRWIRNDLGKAIGKPDDAEQHATAKFLYDGKQWTVLSIEGVIPSRADGEESPAQERKAFAHAMGIPRALRRSG